MAIISRSVRFNPKGSSNGVTARYVCRSPCIGSLHCTRVFARRTRQTKLPRTCVRTSAMAYYLGIDGGGTKTRCVLATESSVLAKAMTGGSNLVRLGETQAREALRAAVYQVCASARISPAQIGAVCIGAAGAARPEIAEKIRAIFAELIPATAAAN